MSKAIVPFRESIVVPPTVDRVNEAIQDQNQIIQPKQAEEEEQEGKDRDEEEEDEEKEDNKKGEKIQFTVPTFNSCTRCLGSLGIIHVRTWLPPSFLALDAWMTSQLNGALIRKLRGTLTCLAYLFDILSIGVCTTRH